MFYCISDPPTVVDGLLDSIKVVNESVIFSCTFTGNPLPYVSWEREDDDVIIPNDQIGIRFINVSIDTIQSTLVITNLIKDDEGNYTCTANNSVSDFIETNDSSTAYLTIFG